MPSTSSPVYTAPFTVAATSTVRFRSLDVAGNLEQVESQLIQIDVTPPTTTAACNDLACTTWFPGPVTLTLTATDTGGSGVSVVRYTVDGSTPTTASPVYSAPLQFTATTKVKFRSWDSVGNVEAVKSATTQIDTIAPTIAITSPANGAKVKGIVTIKTNAADTGGSGLATVAFYVDNVLIGTDTAGPWQFSWSTKNATKGSHTLAAVATDRSGNKTAAKTITVTVG